MANNPKFCAMMSRTTSIVLEVFPLGRLGFTILLFLSLRTDSTTSGSSIQYLDNTPTDRPEPTPSFLYSEADLTIQEGHHAFFNCKIQHLRNKTVSWIRKSDGHILFIGDIKFVDDKRFDLLPSSGYGDWTLRIQFVAAEDHGNYECQISTSPKLSKIFHLNVVVPSVKIQGDKEIYIESGSSVALRCVISNWLIKPKVVFWYRDGVRLLDGFNGVTTNDEDLVIGGSATIVSHLSLAQADPRLHSGKYQCAPEGIKPTEIKLYVIKDQNIAAMQREVNTSPSQTRLSTFILALHSLVLLVWTVMSSTWD